MRKTKRKISLFLAIILIVAVLGGCKDDGTGNTEGTGQENTDGENASPAGNGRFLEHEIALPEGMALNIIQKLSDGSVAAMAHNSENGEKYLLRTEDFGKNWDSIKVNGAEASYIRCMAISPDGSAAEFGYFSDSRVCEMQLFTPQGEATMVPLQLPEYSQGEMGNFVLQAGYDTEGSLFLLDMTGAVQKADTQTGAVSPIFDTSGAKVNYFGIAGTILLAVTDNGILLFDTKTGEILGAESVLDGVIAGGNNMTSTATEMQYPLVFSEGQETESILYAGNDGIYHFTRGGSISEQLVDGRLNSLGDTSMGMAAVVMCDPDNILMQVNDGTGMKLLHFAYDGEASAVPDQELTVYALEESVVLRQTVSLFQKSHPDVFVKVVIGMSKEDGVTVEDALSSLNTDIMAGKGPDVLILDGLPIESYIQKGVLADISDVVDEVEKEDGIFANIKEACQQNGSIYGIPARFLISIVEGDKDTVAAGSSLKSLADRAEQLKAADGTKNVLAEVGAKRFLRELYYADSASWKKEDGTLDTEKLTEFLIQAKRLYDVDSHDPNEEYSLNESDSTVNGNKIGTANSMSILSEEIKINIGTMSGMGDLQDMASAQVQTGTEYQLLNSGSGKTFIPYLTAGVLADGSTEIAKEFVKELLGKEASQGATEGFPINRAAYQADCENKMNDENVENEMSMAFGNSTGDQVWNVVYINLTQELVDVMTTHLESLTAAPIMDRVIQNMVLEQGEKFLSGEQTIADTVEAIQKKVNLYLSE